MPLPVVTSVFTPGAYTSVPKDVRPTTLDPLLVAHEASLTTAHPPRMPLVNPVVAVIAAPGSRYSDRVPVDTRVRAPAFKVMFASVPEFVVMTSLTSPPPIDVLP